MCRKVEQSLFYLITEVDGTNDSSEEAATSAKLSYILALCKDL